MSTREALELLEAACLEAAGSADNVAVHVEVARSAGASWSEIAKATGMTKQGAWTRWERGARR